MLILVPSALAQQDVLPGDDDPLAPEPHPVVESAELERIAGQPLPSQPPTIEPLPVSGQPSTGDPLPKTGGPEIGSTAAVVLPAGALLLGLGVLAYGVSRRR